MFRGADGGKRNRINPWGVNPTSSLIIVVVTRVGGRLVLSTRVIIAGVTSRATKKGLCQNLDRNLRMGMKGGSPGEDFEVFVGRGRTRLRGRWGSDSYNWNLTRPFRARFGSGCRNGFRLDLVGLVRKGFRRRLGDNVYDRALFEGHTRTTRRDRGGRTQLLSSNPLPRPEGRKLPFPKKFIPQSFLLLRPGRVAKGSFGTRVRVVGIRAVTIGREVYITVITAGECTVGGVGSQPGGGPCGAEKKF